MGLNAIKFTAVVLIIRGHENIKSWLIILPCSLSIYFMAMATSEFLPSINTKCLNFYIQKPLD